MNKHKNKDSSVKQNIQINENVKTNVGITELEQGKNVPRK